LVLSLSENKGVDFWTIFRKSTNFRSQKSAAKQNFQLNFRVICLPRNMTRKFTSKMWCVLNFRETFRNCVIKIMLFTIDTLLNICQLIITLWELLHIKRLIKNKLGGIRIWQILNWFSKDFRNLFEIIFKGTKSWIICNLRSFQVFRRL
jgi:hypothetical protein